METKDQEVVESQMNPDQAVIACEDQGLSILPCCAETISLHAVNNPMMVCSECKQLIKCFKEESAFRNYAKFCRSRGRKIVTDFYENYHVIIFRAYN